MHYSHTQAAIEAAVARLGISPYLCLSDIGSCLCIIKVNGALEQSVAFTTNLLPNIDDSDLAPKLLVEVLSYIIAKQKK